MPSRLVEITSTKEDDQTSLAVRLIDAEAEQPYKYIALSHVWASSEPLNTTKSNYTEHRRRIAWESLSEVYQDTFVLAAALGISYVWIDSLCIIQQDPDDWEKEAPRMGLVYGNAYLVFVALGHGLALKKDPVEKLVMPYFIIPSSSEQRIIEGQVADYSVLVRRTCEHENFINPADNNAGRWFTRAWCFQERLFASRLLHFGGSLEDITFECNVHLKCECGGVDLLSHNDRHKDNDVAVSSGWRHLKAHYAQQLREITITNPDLDHLSPGALNQFRDKILETYIALCEDFSAKELSFPDDALPAMGSLASKLGPYMGEYHAGLWEHRILITLQWESFNGSRSRRYGPPCCAPTFSWASRTGGAVWYFSSLSESIKDMEQCELAKVLEVRTESANNAIPYGKVLTSAVHLYGRTAVWHIAEQRPDKVGRLEFADTPDETYVQMDTQDDIDELLTESRGPEGLAEVICFELMRNSGADEGKCFVSALVLRPVQDQPGSFRRVGFSIMEPSAFSERAVFKTVVVV